MNRKVKIERIHEVANYVLQFIDSKDIRELSHLERFSGQIMQITPVEYLLISCNSHKPEKSKYQIEYISAYFQGIILDVRVRPERNSTQFILKSLVRIPEYSNFITDSFGNHVQFKYIRESGIDLIRKEMNYGYV